MATKERHVWARGVVEQAFELEHGRAPSRFEAQCIQAVGLLETSYGYGWSGAGVGSNNWGAVQATPAQVAAGVPTFAYTDSHQDGTRYAQAFRRYATPVEGARDLVRHMTTVRPLTAAAMRDEAGTDEVSAAMYRERYYGGWCPAAIKRFGAGAHRQSSVYVRAGATTEAGRACDAEAIGMHAKKLASSIAEIAAALNEPAPPRSGGTASGWPLLLVAAAAVGGWWWWRS